MTAERGSGLVIAAFALVTAVFGVLGEVYEASVFGLVLAGLVIGRAIGLDRRALAVTGLGLFAVAWILASGLLSDRISSTLAHVVGGALAAWLILESLGAWRPGLAPRAALLGVSAVVLAIGVLWEVAELAADAVLYAGLSLSLGDVAADLLADVAGAAIGAGVALRRRPGSAEPGPDIGLPSAQRRRLDARGRARAERSGRA